ncbi:NACHT domain-containing protein [Micromonospora sp. CA-240977]|uniref:NACHT domain-containing protein n=1 Tax=Micromonospora sp. CA-240977 TaxID=3239957 RepID=UPI003D90D744
MAVLALLNWVRLLSETDLDRADRISSVLSLSVTVVSLMLTWRAARSSAGGDLDEAAHDYLAARTKWLLSEETSSRDLHPPYLQPTRWAGAERTGSIEDVADYFAGLPVRQLVILGAAGSGKSSMALRLAVDLLGSDTAVVPVIVAVSTWDSAQSLDEWLTSTMLQIHPNLGDTRRFGKRAAARAAERILPILDGFDEIPAGARPPVLRRLRAELAAGRSLVLVSQEKAFREAVEKSGVTLPRAAEIIVQPLRSEEAVHYLPAGQHRGEERWHDVIVHIQEKPRGGLAVLLSSPLMIYLARTAFDDPRTDPGLLLAGTVPQARAALMDAFLPAVYRDRRNPALRRYPAEQAIRWLRFLARRMLTQNRTTLHWWQLPDLSRAAILPLRVVVFLTALQFVGMRYGPWIGLAAAVVVSQVVGSLVVNPRPTRLVLHRRLVAYGVVAGGAIGALVGVFVVPEGRLVVTVLASTGMCLAAALLVGVAFGRAPDDDGTDIDRSVRNDRNLLLAALAVSAVVGLRSGVQWNWWMGVQQFVRFLLILLMLFGFARVGVPWLRFAWVRLILASTGRSPFRLLRFLNDAHRRGVLKRTGAGYEFRHSTFLAYLGTKVPVQRLLQPSNSDRAQVSRTSGAAAGQAPSPPSLSDGHTM